jgi:hypothetical protein
MQCLAKRPGDRPQSASELRERLAACRDIPRWRQTDARTWWQEHGEALQLEPADGSHSQVTRILAVDLKRTR